MKLIRKSSEDEMVAQFLRAEIDSQRFGLATAEAMLRHGTNLETLRHPDPNDAADNSTRQAILRDTRGWGRNEGLFRGFPTVASWYLGELEQRDLEELRFSSSIDWNALSGGTGRPLDLANRIASGCIEDKLLEVEEYAAVLAGIRKVCDSITRGVPIPPPIVVNTAADGRIWIVEGFTRCVALILAGKYIGAEVIVAQASQHQLRRWVGVGDQLSGRQSEAEGPQQLMASLRQSLSELGVAVASRLPVRPGASVGQARPQPKASAHVMAGRR